MFEIVFGTIGVFMMIAAAFYIPRAIYHTVCCSSNHPANVADRRRRWLKNHPGATHTPFD